MSRKYEEGAMLKSKGILYFPPVSTFEMALDIYNECGGMIISLEEDGFLVEEPIKIARLYDIKKEHLELYFRDVLVNNIDDADKVQHILSKWTIEEDITNLSI